MNEADFRRSIRKAWKYLDSAGLVELFSNPSPLRASHEFKATALDPSSHYEEVYLTGLRHRDYNLLLPDYSYFQFGHYDRQIRSAYYPNPFFGASVDAMKALGEQHEYLSEGLISMEEFLHEASELQASQKPPPVRYEFDSDAYIELRHPASHLHIGHHAENRWSLDRVLTPVVFSLLIAKLYYSEVWNSSNEIPHGPGTASLDDIFSAAKVECDLLPENLISNAEKSQFVLR